MRVADRPLPTVTLDPGVKPSWPVRPVIALQQKTEPAYRWDDSWATWNDPTQVWDVATVAADWVDATCAFTGLVIESGHPDDRGIFDASRAVFQLDNRSGLYAGYNADGSPSRFGPGQQVAIWAHNPSGDWWLFYGAVARWDELAGDVIECEAFDTLSDLAQTVGKYTPGAGGDLPAARLAAIVTASRLTVRTRFAAGVNHLTAQATELAPLEEMQTVAASDGGLLYGDADGTIVTVDRNWRVGRTDQTGVPTVSDNVCTAQVVVWDGELSTNDTNLADAIVLGNVAGLTATAVRPPVRYTIADTGQQWTIQAEGDALAAFYLTQQVKVRVGLSSATLYLFDPKQPDLWRAVDWRLFDRLRLLHDTRTPTGVARLDVDVILFAIDHELTADGQWIMTVATTRAVAYYAPTLWDGPGVWNDPANVWSY